MTDMHLFIGNKNYSSWSFRPWIAMRHTEIPFQETLVPFTEDPEGNAENFVKFSPSSQVPVLKIGDVTLWESLAILEYLADAFPEKQLWPKDINVRATARAVSSEMHSGFGALRNACPMNMRREPSKLDVDVAVRQNVQRIEQIWDDCLNTHGGPFLFGAFSVADAMYAPVVNRLEIYELSRHDAVLNYKKTMKGLTAWQEWETAGRAEPWKVPYDDL
ncbi:MAG: glutathione S-transferase family protein [Hyphomicrobiales bacterium]